MLRPTSRLLASIKSSTQTSQNVLARQQPLAILPPIPLYRRILRAHKHRLLDPESRLLGDRYVKDEWRRHRDIENPAHIIGFLTEWQLYAQALEGDTWKDEKLDAAKLDKMSDEQIGQMYELMQSITNAEFNKDGEDKDR